jgi:uncharacterized membrane protein YhaH (DUF805 family)
MGFGEAVASCFRNYANFSGRARRSEFWFFRLFVTLVFVGSFVLIAIVGAATGRPDQASPIATVLTLALAIFWLAMFVPDLAVSARRLHDTDRSGWWYLLAFVPFGSIVLLVWWCMKGTDGQNSYGPDPFAPSTHVFE